VFRTHSWGLICFIFCLCPYFSYYACFGLFRVFYFKFKYIESRNGRKGWSWGQMDQGRLQKRPIKPKAEDARQNPWTKRKHQNVAFGKRWNSGASDHHRLLVVGVPRPCCLWRTAVRPRLLRFLLCPFVFLHYFFRFLPFKRWCIWTYWGPNPTPFHSTFTTLHLL